MNLMRCPLSTQSGHATAKPNAASARGFVCPDLHAWRPIERCDLRTTEQVFDGSVSIHLGGVWHSPRHVYDCRAKTRLAGRHCYPLPTCMKLHRFITKWIFKRVFEELLPSGIAHKPGFVAPASLLWPRRFSPETVAIHSFQDSK